MQKGGSALVNGVMVLQDPLSLSPRAAKIVLRSLLHDMEDQIYHVYESLTDARELNDKQLRFARGMT